MKQLHVVNSIASDSGGLGLAALRYAQAQALSGADVTLFVADRIKPEIVSLPEHGQINIVGDRLAGLFGNTLALKKLIDAHGCDLVHIHGVWTPILAIASFHARMRGVPVVVSPHGCLEPLALRHRGWKKKLALALYQRRVFETASMMVATARQELCSIRCANLKAPVAVIPIGVDTVDSMTHAPSEDRCFLFLSRIHPLKGLLDLVNAWALVRREGWRIVIAGPDEDGHLDEIRTRIDQLGIGDDFQFIGLVTGNKKKILFSEADVFILPTYSENFGLVVAEALAHGVPVITTTGAPWEDIVTYRCGWWVTPGLDGISDALVAAMNVHIDELQEMGARGVQLVKEKYVWNQIGGLAYDAYQWMLGNRQQRPTCVNELD